jgi:FkbM family methyltransferase
MEDGRMGSPAFHWLLRSLGHRAVLIDIGASVAPLEIWRPIASHSIYIGFDPDQREMQEVTDRAYHQATIVDEAVAAEVGNDEAHFYFTKSPTCSSTLKPDAASLGEYLFTDLFAVEREAGVRVTTLDAVLDRLDLPGIDWLKTDSQGIDLRLFESLKPERRAKVLAPDLEPGLIDAYLGEDLFVDAHKQLLKSGFWLSDLEVQGTVKMRTSTLDRLKAIVPAPLLERAVRSLKPSPGWLNARYLRTLPWLAQGDFTRRDYVVLWLFACLDAQLDFASDLAVEYEERFGQDETSRLLLAVAAEELQCLSQQRRSSVHKVKSLFR